MKSAPAISLSPRDGSHRVEVASPGQSGRRGEAQKGSGTTLVNPQVAGPEPGSGAMVPLWAVSNVAANRPLAQMGCRLQSP